MILAKYPQIGTFAKKMDTLYPQNRQNIKFVDTGFAAIWGDLTIFDRFRQVSTKFDKIGVSTKLPKQAKMDTLYPQNRQNIKFVDISSDLSRDEENPTRGALGFVLQKIQKRSFKVEIWIQCIQKTVFNLEIWIQGPGR